MALQRHLWYTDRSLVTYNGTYDLTFGHIVAKDTYIPISSSPRHSYGPAEGLVTH